MSEQKASKYYPAEEEAQMKKVRANACFDPLGYLLQSWVETSTLRRPRTAS